jgi:subtilisin-like proprotein convertase family protein
MKLFFTSILATFCLVSHAQTYTGGSGPVSDDGLVNDFNLTVAGLSPTAINTTHGLISICFDITHTYDSDLNIHLVAPDGTEINLVSGAGGSDDNFTGTCLEQTAATSIGTASAPFTGTFKPQENLGNMNNGQNGNGVWKLRIVDTYPADVGFVNSWSITFGNSAPAPFIFNSSNLPIVVINTGGSAIPNEPKINATMGIIYNGPGMTNNITDPHNNFSGNIGIEIRGAFSASLPQKPYSIETRDAMNVEADVSLLGMPAEHDWCLIANYNDKVFMRNTLAYQLFDDMGHYAVRTRFCEVMLNGSYQGIYILMESVKRDNNRINVAKLETTENTGIDVTGGYIIKNDYWNGSDSWLLNYHPVDHPTFDVRLVYDYPKPVNITAQQKTYLQTFINDLETALYSPNYDDPVNGYRKYMSTNSFIDYLIVNELARNNDGFKKSSYFHKDIDPLGGLAKLKAGPVWDFDWAWKDIWGCSIFEATDGSGWAHHINDCNPDVNSTGWYVRMMQDTSFQNDLRCRWENFRNTILSDASLNNYIDSVALYLNAAQSRHFEKWGNLGTNTGAPEVQGDPGTFSANITMFKNWISLRLAWLDANIPGNLVNCGFTGIEETSALSTFSIYPNPANTHFSILCDDRIVLAELYDMTGKKVMAGIKASTIDVTDLPEGIYFCRLQTDKGVLTKKLVLIR